MNIDKSINEWFAIEVKERMDEMELRPYHLRSLCKMTESNVYSCLSGTTLPNLFNLVLLAECLECTVNDLLGYDELEETDVYERYTASTIFFEESQYAVCLADRMRRYLEDRFMTLADLAKNTEMDTNMLRRWFSKTRPHLPPTKKFLHICNTLGCTPSELLGY
jgi:DNA-binding Xre family transcriptional regulator